jgi:hypothetical protein
MLFFNGLIFPEIAKTGKSLRIRFQVFNGIAPAKKVSEFNCIATIQAKKVSELHSIKPILIFAALNSKTNYVII